MNSNTLIALILVFLCNSSCTSQRKADFGAVTSNLGQGVSKVQKIEVIEQTRGTNRLITFISGSKTTSVNGNVSVVVLSAADWENIVKQAELIDLDKISSLTAPSEGRFGDRALASSILITTNGKIYESSTFDSGVPPKELEGLYATLMGRGNSKQKLPKKNFR